VFARIVTYTQADPSPGRIEQGLRRTRERLPGIRELDGIEGAYFFVDRHSGKAIFIVTIPREAPDQAGVRWFAKEVIPLFG
jgi:hypothetical protein